MSPNRRTAELGGWVSLAVVLVGAVALSAIFARYGGELPDELSFTRARHDETHTYPTGLVLGFVWVLCSIIPLGLWYFCWTHNEGARGAFGTIAGSSAGGCIFAATFVIHYGAESASRVADGMLAVAVAIGVGVIVYVLGGRAPRADRQKHENGASIIDGD